MIKCLIAQLVEHAAPDVIFAMSCVSVLHGHGPIGGRRCVNQCHIKRLIIWIVRQGITEVACYVWISRQRRRNRILKHHLKF